jgi:glycosyltransferase involved in cell wall biosynthesis
MAASLPVVSTNVGDLPMVVRDGVSGRLVPPGNPEALAAAALEVLNEPGVAARMGAAGRRHVENFTARAMAEKYEQLYSLGAKRAKKRDK